MAAGQGGDRLDRVRRRMDAAALTLLAVGPGADYRYLTGFSPPYDERLSILLVGPSGCAAVVPSVNALQLETGLAGRQVAVGVYTDDTGPRAAVAEALRRVGAQGVPADRVALGDDLKAAHALELLDLVGPGRPALASAVVAPERMRKDPDEIAALARSAAIDDAAMEAAWAAIGDGVTERQISDAASAAFLAAGGVPAFAAVAVGDASAEPHHEPSAARRVRPGESMFLDLGGDLCGYQSDLTRMACLGAPPDGYRRIHDLVAEAARAAREVARPGATCQEVDAAARKVIADAGYGDRFVHRTGHGIGLTTHEPPSIVAGNHLVLEEGMAFSIEPGVYLPGQFGVRLEDIVVVGPSGCRVLSRLPHECHRVD